MEYKCRGCEKVFDEPVSRKSTCDSCASDSVLYTRIIRYGISGLKIKKLFKKKKGLCFLCHRLAKDVDHNHDNQRVRGVLCHGCNLSISRVEDSRWLKSALKYLKEDGEAIEREFCVARKSSAS